ncbi:MAG: hypothetical protein DMG14_15620 [Acidobacteria bacterium]|nr:MAG: hypothetical protein DMG14_15620 [Acidobacteriota bacterium]
MMKKLKYTRNAIIKTIIVLLAFTVLCFVVPARAQNRGRNRFERLAAAACESNLSVSGTDYSSGLWPGL